MNVKRNLLIAILLSGLSAAGAASGAHANSWWLEHGFFGSPTRDRPDVTIKIGSTTGSIYVDHFATAMIENDKGESFVWRFDSELRESSFPLKTIAPHGFDAGKTWVIIRHPAGHLPSEG